MAGGINTAKQIVMDEVDSLVTDLQNGNANNSETQGRAIALMLKMFKPMYMAEFITVEQCSVKHDELVKQIEPNKAIKIKVGPFEIAGNFSHTIILSLIMCSGFGGLIFVIGKTQNWW